MTLAALLDQTSNSSERFSIARGRTSDSLAYASSGNRKNLTFVKEPEHLIEEEHSGSETGFDLRIQLSYRLQKRLTAMARLLPDWDGYGAAPLSSEVFQNTRTLLNSLNQLNPLITSKLLPDNVYPNSHGTLNLVWKHLRNEDCELSIEIGTKNCCFLAEFPTESSEGLDFFAPNDKNALLQIQRAFERMQI